jgi:hypothetical protein
LVAIKRYKLNGRTVRLGRRNQQRSRYSSEVIMSVNTISSSTTTTTTSPLSAVSPTQTQQLQNSQKQKPAEEISSQPAPKPTVNTNGTTIGSRINTTA